MQAGEAFQAEGLTRHALKLLLDFLFRLVLGHRSDKEATLGDGDVTADLPAFLDVVFVHLEGGTN